MLKILIVEDDYYLNQLINKNLSNNGYSVVSAYNGQKALEVLNQQQINLVLTDLCMPQMTGQMLIKQIKQTYTNLPIIVISALNQFSDKKDCYAAGIDDYIVKPINFDELLLRIEALLRRCDLVHQKHINYLDVHLDFTTKQCFIKQTLIDLTKKEFLILYMLIAHPQRIYSREEILNEIWDVNSTSTDRTVDVHITNLREKLNMSKLKIINVRGLGYKIE